MPRYVFAGQTASRVRTCIVVSKQYILFWQGGKAGAAANSTAAGTG